MRKFLLLLLVMATAPNAFSQVTELFFSEYVEGSSYEKYLEIFNGTGAVVDLTDYQLLVFSNGAPESDPSFTLTFADEQLNDGEVLVLGHSRANLLIPDLTASMSGFNGNDAIALKKISKNELIDIIGCIGEDPGTAWSEGTLSTRDMTLVRKASVSAGVKVNPSTGFPTLSTEWDTYDMDDVSHLGSHTQSTVTAVKLLAENCFKVIPNPFDSGFSIEGDGISLVQVYGLTGRLVKELAVRGGGPLRINGLGKGMYIVKVIYKDGSLGFQKAIGR